MNTLLNKTSRELFEDWHVSVHCQGRALGCLDKDKNDTYTDPKTQSQWEAWHARDKEVEHLKKCLNDRTSIETQHLATIDKLHDQLKEALKPTAANLPLRAHAALTLRLPTSGIDWLDDMIREVLKGTAQT